VLLSDNNDGRGLLDSDDGGVPCGTKKRRKTLAEKVPRSQRGKEGMKERRLKPESEEVPTQMMELRSGTRTRRDRRSDASRPWGAN
jgi:hypothetical protein